ncbi:hypothetical protein NUW54_g370 [Trametes sanguinea]|uniref:Uncharacterized protein n=1 Tax=Trametes sanguinea TaxID=158606 RepID=A0ACC1QB79_9APHY|nr:hypothetical protein NUW54_g370 [Trametes sanguinea]
MKLREISNDRGRSEQGVQRSLGHRTSAEYLSASGEDCERESGEREARRLKSIIADATGLRKLPLLPRRSCAAPLRTCTLGTAGLVASNPRKGLNMSFRLCTAAALSTPPPHSLVGSDEQGHPPLLTPEEHNLALQVLRLGSTDPPYPSYPVWLLLTWLAFRKPGVAVDPNEAQSLFRDNTELKEYLERGEYEKVLNSRQVHLQYIKGHAGHEGNEGVDRIANLGATLPLQPERDWKALMIAKFAERAKGAVATIGPSPSSASISNVELEEYAACLADDGEWLDEVAQA